MTARIMKTPQGRFYVEYKKFLWWCPVTAPNPFGPDHPELLLTVDTLEEAKGLITQITPKDEEVLRLNIN